ncbi:MAG: secretin N-terminal domain-containing protein, partial [Pirellulaceae bacterium]
QAMDIINGVLLGKGYSLVRRERVLMVLDLGSGESADVIRGYIREVAQLVDPMELDDRGEYELLKSLFPLSRMTPDEAKKEIEMLIGPQGSVIPLPSSSQVLVTETAGKLRLVRDMLMRVEDPTTGQGTIITLPLKNLSADELLAVVRPLLGLQGESNTSTDINLSTDTFGNTIYATGSAEKLQKLRDLAKAIDVAPEEKSGTNVDVAQPSLKTHRVISSDPDTALEVLQTLMAGAPNVRLAKDPMTNHIIAFATPDDHALIEKTLKELAGDSADFTVIPLKRIDPQAALLMLEKFFGKKSGEGESGSKGPTFYGDTLARTIMVQGTKDQIDQVQALIGKLEESGPAASSFGDSIRTLPLTGRSSERVMEQLEQLWQSGGKTNRIRVIKPKDPRRDARRQPNTPGSGTNAPANDPSNRSDVPPSASAVPPRGTPELQDKLPQSSEAPATQPQSDPAAPQPEPAAPANPEIGLRAVPAGRWTSTAASQPPAQEEAAQNGAPADSAEASNNSVASDSPAVEATQEGANTLTDPTGKEIVVIQ